MEANNQITKWLTSKNNFAESSASYWQNIVEKYPAFTLAQLFLAKKLKQENNEKYLQQLPKTALHFSDVLWLNFLINQPENAPLQSDKEDDKQEAEKFIEENNDTHLTGNKLSSILEKQAAEFNKPIAEGEQLSIEKEPLYKTDYFASQGIIYTKPQDAFENKVKKFTDWLKDIKKTNTGAPQFETTLEEEKLSEEKAQASLKTEEIITEPMAEVLIQQNKSAQAIELYKKLSLLYPEKSSYFASKIKLIQ